MYRRIVKLALICLFADPNFLQTHRISKILDRMVQVHGFASQGFIYTNDNNWLTMNTRQGSGAFTDFGLNMSAHSYPDGFYPQVNPQGFKPNPNALVIKTSLHF